VACRQRRDYGFTAVSSSYAASIEMADPSQTGLQSRPEHCSGDPDLLATIGRALAHQVRIVRSPTERALYTVSAAEGAPGTFEPIVRMGGGGLARLGATEGFPGTVEARVTHPSFTDAQAEAHGEFVERLYDNGINRGFIVIAPHGGDIERRTDDQAVCVIGRLYDKAVSGWICRGWYLGGGAFRHWHITSTDLHEASFPKLARVLGRPFRFAVAFHGFDDEDIRHDILLGGIAPDRLKLEIKAALEAAVPSLAVHITRPDEKFGGDSRQNVVNRLAAGGAGIQLEQKPHVRDDHARAVADAVAGVYRSKLARFEGCKGSGLACYLRCAMRTTRRRAPRCPLD
jgi:phage replication-related protein YjqB (UPF0714/DUF867 family)